MEVHKTIREGVAVVADSTWAAMQGIFLSRPKTALPFVFKGVSNRCKGLRMSL